MHDRSFVLHCFHSVLRPISFMNMIVKKCQNNGRWKFCQQIKNGWKRPIKIQVIIDCIDRNAMFVFLSVTFSTYKYIYIKLLTWCSHMLLFIKSYRLCRNQIQIHSLIICHPQSLQRFFILRYSFPHNPLLYLYWKVMFEKNLKYTQQAYFHKVNNKFQPTFLHRR